MIAWACAHVHECVPFLRKGVLGAHPTRPACLLPPPWYAKKTASERDVAGGRGASSVLDITHSLCLTCCSDPWFGKLVSRRCPSLVPSSPRRHAPPTLGLSAASLGRLGNPDQDLPFHDHWYLVPVP